MPNQKGIAQIALVIFLLVAIAVSVYLVGQQTNLLPKAGFLPSPPVPPEVSLSLSPVFENLPDPVPLLQSEEVKQETKGSPVLVKPNYQVGDYIPVVLLARSDREEANLFVAKIKFDQELLEVISVDLPDIPVGSQAPIADLSFVKNWVEQTFDQKEGTISLVGGVPSPGFKTESLDYPGVMTLIIFQAKKEGTATISFTDNSQVLRNSDNQNILQYKDNTQVVIGKKKACDDAIGQSQLTGCLYDGKNFEKEDGQAPAGPVLSSPVPDQAQALLQDWGYEAPNEIVGKNEFSAGWAGQFKFKKGTYRFFAGADDGVRVKIDRVSVLDDWSDTSFREREFNYTFFEEGTHLIELEYYENTGAAKVSLRWEYQQASSPTPVPTPTSPPSSPPPGQKGDGNTDGKINLTDMSVLLTDFNKEKGFREPIDMNGDGKINTFDYSLHRKLLIEIGVIKEKIPYPPPQQ